MENNFQEEKNISQMGVSKEPIQVESVQYNIGVSDYKSKPSTIFTIANICMSVGLFVLASLLFNLTGTVFNFTDNIAENIQVTISILIPVSIIGYIAITRLNSLFRESPAAIEDVKFKSHLRKSFLFFLTLSGIGTFIAVFNFIEMFINFNDTTIKNQFFSLYYVGGLIVMTLWLYSYQKQTKR